MIHLRVLGGLSLANGLDARGAAGQRKSLVLLAVIACAPNGGITREKLLGYFWPENDEEQGKNALRQRLFSLRRDLGVEDLFIGTATLRLNPGVVNVDLWDMERAASSDDLERVAALYTGPFLDGVYLRGAPELSRWIEEQRARTATIATRAITALARRAEAAGDHAQATAAWRQLAAAEPASSAAAAGLIRALAASGDRVAALEQFRLYATLMREEYGLEPDAFVVAVEQAIRDGRHARRISPDASTPIAVGTGETSQPAHAEPAALPAVPTGSQVVVADPVTSRWARARWAAGAIVVVTAGAFAVARGESDRDRLLDKNRAMIAEFRNETGDSSLALHARTATTVIAQELARSGVAKVVDARLIIPKESPVRGAPMLESARELGAGFLVTGVFLRRGDSLAVEATVVDVASGFAVQTIRPRAVPLDSAAVIVDPLARRIAGAIGSLQDPLFTAATASPGDPPLYEAYSEYMAGLERLQSGEQPRAAQHFLKAIELDSGFVHAALWGLEVVGDSVRRQRLIGLIERRRETLAPVDQARLDYQKAFDARDLETAYSAARKMARLEPGSFFALIVHGRMAMFTNRFREAARTYGRIDLDRPWPADWVGFYWEPSLGFHLAGDYGRELDLWNVARDRYPADWNLCGAGARPLAAMGRMRELHRRIEECALHYPDLPALGRFENYMSAALELHIHGHRSAADSMLQLATVIAESHHDRRRESRLARVYFASRRYDRAAPMLVAGVNANPDAPPIAIGEAAIAAAGIGDTATVRRLRERLIAIPRPRPVTLTLARIAAVQGEKDEAIRLLNAFKSSGGLLATNLHAEPAFESLWNTPDWKMLMQGR